MGTPVYIKEYYMYNRDLETSVEKKRQHDESLKAAASKRLAEVASKMKLKRNGKPKGYKPE